jgi:hypothetical protein
MPYEREPEDEDVIEGQVEGEPEAVMAAVDEEPPPEEQEWEIFIRHTAWDPGYREFYIDFEVPSAPRMPKSKMKTVWLRTQVALEAAPADAKRLGSGQSRSSALARAEDVNVYGKDITEPAADVVRAARVPKAPPVEAILEACKKELQRHLDEVQKAVRLQEMMEQQANSLEGQSFKVKA